MSTKEEILKAAKENFDKKEVFIDKANKISIFVVELDRKSREALDDKLFAKNSKHEFIKTDKDDKIVDGGTFMRINKDVDIVHEWIAATTLPALSLDEIADLPESLKTRMYDDARKVNGLDVSVAAKN